VDQIRQKGDRAGEDEDPRLDEYRQAEDAEAERDRLDAGARAKDRPIDEAVAVPVLVAVPVVVVAVVTLVLVRVLGVGAPVAHGRRLSPRDSTERSSPPRA